MLIHHIFVSEHFHSQCDVSQPLVKFCIHIVKVAIKLSSRIPYPFHVDLEAYLNVYVRGSARHKFKKIPSAETCLT